MAAGSELVLDVLRYSEVLNVLNNASRLSLANIAVFFCRVRPTTLEISGN